MINFQFFPKNKPITTDLESVVNCFRQNAQYFESSKFSLESNVVLSYLTKDLIQNGYRVETSKKKSDKISVPVLYGKNGTLEQHFDADAYNEEKGIVIEVEAGRAVTNYQFLKDLFEAIVMSDVNYLVIAVRNDYRGNSDFEKVTTFFNTLYTSNRIQLPLNGILIIGY